LSAEKKSLRRFLLTYLFSTLLLIGIGEWFYYKSAVREIYDKQFNYVLNELKLAIPQGMFGLRFYDNKSDINITVYKRGMLVYGKNVKLNNKECWIDKGVIYCRNELPRRWGKIEFVGYKKFDFSPVDNLRKQILLSNVFILIFLIIIAYVLGKMFLKPVRDTIKNLENFIRDATHEMNTPISVILTNIEMLKMKKIESKEIQRIESSAKRLEKIFKDLTFVRLNHNRKKEIISVNLKDIINERVEMCKTFIENKKIKIIKECEDFVVKADREDINRLIDNLLSNAVKYSPQDETVHLSIKNGVFCISNRGEIKNLNKITEKFYRENKNEGGFGLGLYIVKKICENYGYKLDIKNEKGFVKISVKFK